MFDTTDDFCDRLRDASLIAVAVGVIVVMQVDTNL
jgi:hypothetical protein